MQLQEKGHNYDKMQLQEKRHYYDSYIFGVMSLFNLNF